MLASEKFCVPRLMKSFRGPNVSLKQDGWWWYGVSISDLAHPHICLFEGTFAWRDGKVRKKHMGRI